MKEWMKRFIRPAVYIAVFAALLGGSAFLTYRVMITRMTVEVPDLTGMDLTQADRALEGRGLYLKVLGEENDAGIPKGHIISQDVPPGTDIKGMAEIKVLVSKGPAVTKIPDAVGEKLDDALKLFTREGLEVKVVEVHSNTVEKGTVIAQSPIPEKWTGQGITLLASLGPYPVVYYCPSFIGLLKDDALMLARELGLNVELEAPEAASVVEEQKPLPGRQIASGDILYLKFSEVESYD
ncbi:MAG: PASTA domain-containing protein [Nitrospirota bacterium]